VTKTPHKRQYDPEKALLREVIEKMLSEPLDSEDQDEIDVRITEDDKRRAEADIRDLVLQLSRG
jgi:hypothetical protein